MDMTYLNDLSNKACVLNKTEDLNIYAFSLITDKKESKILTKHASCKFGCDFDGRKCNSNQKWNNVKCRCGCKKHISEKGYNWNPAGCSCKNGKDIESSKGLCVVKL